MCQVSSFRNSSSSPWIIPGIVPVGLTVLIGGPPSATASLGLDFALAISSGKQALGITLSEPMPSCVFALYDCESTFQSRLKHSGHESFQECYVLFRDIRHLLKSVDNVLLRMESILHYYEARMIVIEAFAALGISSSKRSLLLRSLNRFGHENGLAVILRRDGSTSRSKDSLVRSFRTSCDAWNSMALTRQTNGEYSLRVFGSFENNEYLLAHPDNRPWKMLGRKGEGSMHRCETVLRQLRKRYPTPTTAAKMASVLDKPVGTMNRIMWTLAKSGHITATGKGYLPL